MKRMQRMFRHPLLGCPRPGPGPPAAHSAHMWSTRLRNVELDRKNKRNSKKKRKKLTFAITARWFNFCNTETIFLSKAALVRRPTVIDPKPT